MVVVASAEPHVTVTYCLTGATASIYGTMAGRKLTLALLQDVNRSEDRLNSVKKRGYRRSHASLSVEGVNVRKLALLASIVIGIAAAYVMIASAQQYPIMDKVADKVIAKYQQSSCEQLYEKRARKASPSLEEQRAIQLLKGDPQMREAFINRVAPPIANKLFECGLIP